MTDFSTFLSAESSIRMSRVSKTIVLDRVIYAEISSFDKNSG